MLPVTGWKIFYADGSTFSSDDGPWRDAPREGVQAVTIYHEPPYRDVEVGLDEYRDPLKRSRAVKLGSAIDLETFDRIYERALAD
jgi:hypothetical protein